MIRKQETNNSRRFRHAALLTLLFLGPSQPSFATVDFFQDIFFTSGGINGSCTIGLEDEPYIAANADCQTIEPSEDLMVNSEIIAYTPVSGFQFDQYPHDEYTPYSWQTSYVGEVNPNVFYCQIQGFWEPGSSPVVQLGTATGVEEFYPQSEELKCRQTTLMVEAYTTEYCAGSAFTLLFSSAQLIPGVHLSFRFAFGGGSSLCFPFTIDPRP